jgi:two-component system, OmpR family, response regulator VanR
MNSYNVLVVEDEKEIADAIEIYLKNQGYTVFKGYNGIEGLEIINKEEVHLAIVDIMMPKMDGITMTVKLREKYDFPIIMLSAKSEEVDKIVGLNIGADDYVAKPFTPLELLARVNSQLRRYSKYLSALGVEKEKTNSFIIGGLELNVDKVELVLTEIQLK